MVMVGDSMEAEANMEGIRVDNMEEDDLVEEVSEVV